MNNLNLYLIISSLLFAIGFATVVSKKNLIMILMGIELMLNAVNINFVAFSKYDPKPENAYLFSIFIMMVSAAEISIGLAIVLKIKDKYKNINPDSLINLKN